MLAAELDYFVAANFQYLGQCLRNFPNFMRRSIESGPIRHVADIFGRDDRHSRFCPVMRALEPHNDLGGVPTWGGFCPDFGDPIFTKFCFSGHKVFGNQEVTIARMLDACRALIIVLESNERDQRESDCYGFDGLQYFSRVIWLTRPETK